MALVTGSQYSVEGIKPLLTINPAFEGDKTIQLWMKGPKAGSLYVPRALTDGTTPVSGVWDEVSFKVRHSLRPEQKTVVDQYMQALKKASPYGGIIKSPTNTGKTVMGLHIAHRMRMPFLIVVHTAHLMNQWIERILEHTNLTRKDIGILRQGSFDYKGKTACVGLVHSLSKGRYADCYSYFGHVIFDECHTLGAYTFSKVAAMFNSKYRTGLSATPKRQDNAERVFLYHIGKVLVSATPKTLKPNVLIHSFYSQMTSHAGCMWGGSFGIGRYINRIVKCHKRNELIAELVKKAYDAGRTVLMLTDRLSQIRSVHTILLSLGVKAQSIGHMTQLSKQVNTKIILGTYGSAGTGMDVADISCIVMATPKANIEQNVGRIRTAGEGKENPLIIDIVDSASTVMMRWAEKREQFYRTVANEIRRVKSYDSSAGLG